MGGFFSKQLNKTHPNADTIAHTQGIEEFAAKLEAERDAKVKKGTEMPPHGYMAFPGVQ